MCDGASPEERQRWKLLPAKEYHYLNQSTCFELTGVSNTKEFRVRTGSTAQQKKQCSVHQERSVGATTSRVGSWLLAS